jgi:hypothetical protein
MALIIKNPEQFSKLFLPHEALKPQLVPAPTDKVEAVEVQAQASSTGEPAVVIAIDCNEETATQAPEVVDPRLQQVLRHAKRRFHLFPLAERSKSPMKDFAWKECATNDPSRLEAYFTDFPGCNWAVATGSESNVFVLDVDGKEGCDTLESFTAKGWAIAPTLTSETGRPWGYHLWFRYPGEGITIPNSTGDSKDTDGRRVQLWRAVRVEGYSPVEKEHKDKGGPPKDHAGN